MSQRFRFRLDPVLGHRERVERERAGEHAQALADQLAAQRMYDEIVEKRDELRVRLVSEHARFDAETLRATYTHLDYLDRAIVAALQRVDACVAETERARQRLVAAAKDRKVLETLKERRQEAFQLDAALADQRELDDQNARLFGRANPFEGLPS
jgi:flagellar export protein FliJ